MNEAQQERATDLEFLEFFYSEAGNYFGPADSDIRYTIQENFIEETGMLPPEGYYYGDEL